MVVFNLICAGVFFVCVVLLFSLSVRIRIALARRHQEFKAALNRWIWLDPTLFFFVWSKKSRALGDPALTRAIDRYRLVAILGALSWLGLGFATMSNA